MVRAVAGTTGVPTGTKTPTFGRRAYHQALRFATRTVVEPVLGAAYLTRSEQIDEWWQLDESERDNWQAEALAQILSYAVEHVPAYHRLRPEFGEFPIVDKQDIIADTASYRSDEHESRPAVVKHTGGSTGDPWSYSLDRVAWAESYAAHIRACAQRGVLYGDRRVLLGFPSSLGLKTMGPAKRLRLAAERTDASLSGLRVDPVTSLRRAERASAGRAQIWYGYASTIAAMASAVLNAGRTLPGPPLIVTMAEPLMGAWREDIEEAFGSTVLEEYGCNDGGIMAHRCTAGNLHLADHQSLVEVVDDHGRACAEGVDGNIVITNFHARHMPFIRYRVGDLGVLGPSQCSCGSPGRTLARVTGRSGDMVRLPDGTELVPAAFYIPFNQVTGVRRWQIVQPDRDRLVVRIEPRSGWDHSERQLVQSWVEDRTMNQVSVELVETEPLELTNGGKHRIVIRQFS